MHIRAPGKIILLGEYAVLHGGPSLVVSVDRFVECSISEDSVMQIDSPLHGSLRFPIAESDSNHLPFARKLVDEQLKNSQDKDLLTARYNLDSRGFYEADSEGHTTKLGLGSSAASTVALAGGLYAQEGRCLSDELNAIYGAVQEAHRSVQGLGSGADVAASTFGGALAYRWLDKRPLFTDPKLLAQSEATLSQLDSWRVKTSFGVAEMARLKSHEPLVAVWTGRAANTGELVRSTRRLFEQQPNVYRALIRRLATSASTGLAAWCSDHRRALMDTMIDGTDALRELGVRSGVSLVTKEHDTLAQRIEKVGATSKPTGAGGGDLSWVLGPESMTADELIEKLSELGYKALRFGITEKGLERISGG